MIEENITTIDGKYKFIKFQDYEAEIYFSTAEGGLSFNINNEEDIKNINNLKKWFGLKDIGYLNQIHSDIIHIYDGSLREGDSIMTREKRVAIGVFTADCVPIIIYDKVNKAISAVHSGWKGTFNCIVPKSILKMQENYNSQLKDLSIFIGPHNMKCCYEVGIDLIEKFLNNKNFDNKNIIQNNNLSMQDCILNQLKSIGIEDSQVKLINKCTSCNEELNLHSYRKSSNKSGRMFSFIFLK